MYKVSLGLGVAMTITAIAVAQGTDSRQRNRGGPPRGPAQPPGFHLLRALDADQDGKVSKAEIDNAVAALETLDRDHDGKLSADEIGWPPARDDNAFPVPGGFPGPGRRGGPGRGGFAAFSGSGGGFPGFGGGPPGFGPGGPPGFGGRFEAGRPQRPDPDDIRSRAPGGPSSKDNWQPRSFFSVDELTALDRDQDGKITRQEIPKRLQKLVLDRVDANEDDIISKDELNELAAQLASERTEK